MLMPSDCNGHVVSPEFLAELNRHSPSLLRAAGVIGSDAVNAVIGKSAADTLNLDSATGQVLSIAIPSIERFPF